MKKPLRKGFISFEVLETWAIETRHKDLSVEFIDHCIKDLKHWKKELKNKQP